MSHDHHDHRSLGITSLNKAFVIGIVLNAGFVVAEFIAGFWYNSLGLISDAGHNLGDVFSLVLAMLAFRLAKVSPTLRYTYGYKKSTILVSLLNAVILLVAVGFILGESIDKLFHPRPVDGDAVAVSVGVVVSGIVIQHTGWYMMDPLTGILIALFIVYSTWGLLRDSLRLSLDGVPQGISYDRIGQIISTTPGVDSFHHMHIWGLSTTEIALTAHIVVADMVEMEQIKSELKCRLQKAGIGHATLELELPGQPCQKEPCH